MKLKITTWNTHNTTSTLKVLKLISTTQTTIIALQESYQYPFYRHILANQVKKIYPNMNVKVDKFFGLCTIIISNREIDVRSTPVGTGPFFLGNKGFLLSRVSVGGESFVFVNAHLNPYRPERQLVEVGLCLDVVGKLYGVTIQEEMRDKDTCNENSDFINIRRRRVMSVGSSCGGKNKYTESTNCGNDRKCSEYIKLPKKIKAVILAGDFNFRATANNKIRTINHMGKLKIETPDSLRYNNTIDNSHAFLAKYPEFKEHKISFMPTYKYRIGTNEYNTNRVPSWCDRVFIASSYGYEITDYSSIGSVKYSDHKPVSAEIRINEEFVLPIIFEKYETYPRYGLQVSIFFGTIFEYYLLVLVVIIVIFYYHLFRDVFRGRVDGQ